ncbi:hypothetical protein D3C71_1916240 [compost metagenome]
MGDAHGGGDDEDDQHQPAHQRDDLAAVQHPVFQRISHARGDQRQQQETFLLEGREHGEPFCRVEPMSY